MIIERIVPQGYCKGVQRAIQKVLSYRKEHPETPMTIYGPLVHNENVVQALQELGIRTLSKDLSLEQVQEGCVVFSAHGIPASLMEEAKNKGLEVLVTTCPFVLRSHQQIEEHLQTGDNILYIGKKGHPECVAALSLDPDIILVEDEHIPDGLEGKVFVINQTTLAIPDLKSIHQAIQKKYPDALFADEICGATRTRQTAVLNLDADRYDKALVIGDPRSSNTSKLLSLAQRKGIPARMVGSYEDLKEEDFQAESVALLSGASTPLFLVDQIEDALLGRDVKPADAASILNNEKAA